MSLGQTFPVWAMGKRAQQLRCFHLSQFHPTNSLISLFGVGVKNYLLTLSLWCIHTMDLFHLLFLCFSALFVLSHFPWKRGTLGTSHITGQKAYMSTLGYPEVDRRPSLGSYWQHPSFCRFTEGLRLDYSRAQPCTWHQIDCLPSETISLASGLLFISSNWGGICFLQL